MLLNLLLLLTFILIARPQDFFSFLIPARPALVLTFIVLIGVIFSGKISDIQNIKKNSQLKKYILFYAIMIISVPFSVHRGQSFDFIIFQFLSKVLYFYLFVLIISSMEELEKVLFTVCFANLFYVGFSLLSTGSFAGRFRFGTMYDPNDLAYFLISLFPLSFYFLNSKGAGFKRIIAALTIMLSILVSIMTGSRGGFLGLLTVAFFLFFTKLSPLKRFYKIVLFAILVAAVSLNIEKIDTDRFSSLLDTENDYNVTSEEGRMAVWRRGLQLTLLHPITGVGVNCFSNAIGYYRQEIGVLPKWQAPHNSFIQVLTELGIPGFFVFLSLIASTIKILYSCGRKNLLASTPTQEFVLMSRLILLAFIGNLVTTFFLSMAYSILFTLFFAFSAVLKNLREGDEESCTV